MTRPRRSSAGPNALDRTKGLPRKRSLSSRYGSPALVRDRLDTLAAAFLADARPGLIFEYGRLIFANDAARALLQTTDASDAFLNALKASVDAGRPEQGLLLRTPSGIYAPVIHPSRSRKGHPTRICLLVKRSEVTEACECLSDRELDVVRLLVKGLTNQQIADELGISIETVRKHVSKALEKTGTRTRAGLVGRALER